MRIPRPEVYIEKRLVKGRINLEITLLEDMPFTIPPDGFLWLLPRRLRVPAGYVSDGASVPRFLWRILSPQVCNTTLGPSIAHDWLYDKHKRYGLSRRECDLWYHGALYDNGYPGWKCDLTYIGVRLFGWMHWRRK